MNELTGQKEKTRKKKPEETRHQKGDTSKPMPGKAGEATSRASAKDKEYVERIEEKTKKH